MVRRGCSEFTLNYHNYIWHQLFRHALIDSARKAPSFLIFSYKPGCDTTGRQSEIYLIPNYGLYASGAD